MIKPERMSRIAIVGPRKKLDITIRSLYELNLFHLVDYLGDDPEVKIGNPLPEATDISQRLLRLRSIVRALHLGAFKTELRVSKDEIERTSDQAIVTLELEVNKKVETRQALSSRIRELAVQNEILADFAKIGIPLDAYTESETLTSFSGIVQTPIEDRAKALGIPLEIIEMKHGTAHLFTIFCKKENAEAVQEILSTSGYQELRPPLRAGDANKHIIANQKEIEKLEKSLSSEEKEIEALREKYAPLVLAADEHYSIEIKKAETPLRVATTPNSFVIDGWIPVSSVEAIRRAVAEVGGGDVSVEPLSVSKQEEDEQAPVRLNNRRIVKPFEMFIELMSTPLYREVDPTLFVFAVFPLFFGFMIGDFGYGACLMLAGYVMVAKLGKESMGWKRLGYAVFAGGLFASIFGFFLYAEAFGLPFHPVINKEGEAMLGGLSWEGFGVNLPLHPILEKLVDVKDLLALSVLAAWVHMSIGYAVGFFNELHHSRKEAAMKILWLIILLGLFFQILFMARGSELRDFIFIAFCSPFSSYVISMSGISLSIVALSLILAGLAGFFVIHRAGAMMELMETLSLLANVISYTRIAAIAVAKGAMALAFNYIVAVNFINGGNIVMIIIGCFVLVLLQLMVFALGSLSAGIQAIRLNYYEFFLKFFTGGGVSFEPLGYKRKYSKESEV